MVVTFVCTRGHAPHVACGRKTLQMYGFPMQTYGKTLRRHNFNSKVWIKNLCSNLHAHQILSPESIFKYPIIIFESFSFYLVYNFKQAPHTKQKKKMSGKQHIVGSHNERRQFWTNLVMVVTFMCTRGHAPHVVRGHETLQTYGFPIQTYGKLQSAITLILRCESKILLHHFSVLIKFCVHM